MEVIVRACWDKVCDGASIVVAAVPVHSHLLTYHAAPAMWKSCFGDPDRTDENRRVFSSKSFSGDAPIAAIAAYSSSPSRAKPPNKSPPEPKIPRFFSTVSPLRRWWWCTKCSWQNIGRRPHCENCPQMCNQCNLRFLQILALIFCLFLIFIILQ